MEAKELDGLVRKLEVQVGRLEMIVPQVTSQAETISQHSVSLAGLATWRDEHEKADVKREEARVRRYAGWSAILSAVLVKMLDWAHAHTPHINLSGIFAGH